MSRFRWRWAQDLNGDGRITISEVWAWLGWLYYYPGDAMVNVYNGFLQSDLAKFFEMTPGFYGGRLSWWTSLAVWGFLFMGIVGQIEEFQEWRENRRRLKAEKAEEERMD